MASRINSRNSSIFWESDRTADYVYTALRRQQEVDGNKDMEPLDWIDRFEKDKTDAALTCWYEVHKGIHESLREF
jgi:glyceraldehyde-3-phosphate dehydrogenase (ferredoxin)